MSKKLLIDMELKRKLSKFLKENDNIILDIIIFGSSTKGKEKPRDLDLLVIHKNKKNYDLSHSLKKQLESKVQIVDKTYRELFSSSFNARESILSEGFSIKTNGFLSNELGYNNYQLFKYNLRGFSKSNRMRFYYSLYGRSNQGFLDSILAIKFSDSIILCPIENSEKMKDFFQTWNIDFVDFPVLIPTRIQNLFNKLLVG